MGRLQQLLQQLCVASDSPLTVLRSSPESLDVTRVVAHSVHGACYAWCPSYWVDRICNLCPQFHPIRWTMLRNFVHVGREGECYVICPCRMDNVTVTLSILDSNAMNGESNGETNAEKRNHGGDDHQSSRMMMKLCGFCLFFGDFPGF
jgi:hypothetical protein